jgi:hypothetical protein
VLHPFQGHSGPYNGCMLYSHLAHSEASVTFRLWNPDFFLPFNTVHHVVPSFSHCVFLGR